MSVDLGLCYISLTCKTLFTCKVHTVLALGVTMLNDLHVIKHKMKDNFRKREEVSKKVAIEQDRKRERC